MEEEDHPAVPAGTQEVRDNYEAAYRCLSEALIQDKAGHRARALELYSGARGHLLQGVSVPSSGAGCQGPIWDSARQMQQKMKATLSDVTSSLAVLEATSAGIAPRRPSCKPCVSEGFSPAQTYPPKGATGVAPLATPSVVQVGDLGELPPAYTPWAVDGHRTVAYGNQASERLMAGNRHVTFGSGSQDDQELLFISWGVQVFFVTPDGQVRASSYPGELRIIRHADQPSKGSARRATVSLQACDWGCTLSSDTPVLLNSSGVFMFPDTSVSTPGSYIGVVLSSALPAADREAFQGQLFRFTDLRIQEQVDVGSEVVVVETEEPQQEKILPEWSEKVAHGITTGATWLSSGLVRGAELTSRVVHRGGSKLREHITPEEKPVQVSPGMTRGLQVARQASGGALKVSQVLVDGVCTVAGCVGRGLAPHIKKHGTKLVPESLKRGSDGRANVDGAKNVAVSGVQGLATVWSGLEVASKNIGKSVALETVSTVKHKYGDEAGQATNSALHSTFNVGLAAVNFDHLALRALGKSVSQKTSAATATEPQRQKKPKPS